MCSDDRDSDVFVYLSLFLTLGTPALNTQLGTEKGPSKHVVKDINLLGTAPGVVYVRQFLEAEVPHGCKWAQLHTHKTSLSDKERQIDGRTT